MTRQRRGQARFAFPPDLARYRGRAWPTCDLARAELRFGAQRPARAWRQSQGPGRRARRCGCSRAAAAAAGRGFFAFIDAAPLAGRDHRRRLRLCLARQRLAEPWRRRPATRAGRRPASWPHPRFGGSFLPATGRIGDDGFSATYRIGNLALGRSLVSTADAGRQRQSTEAGRPPIADYAGRARPASSGCRPPRSA